MLKKVLDGLSGFGSDFELEYILNYTEIEDDIDNRFCALKHGPIHNEVKCIPAVNILCRIAGYSKTGGKYKDVRVPLCEHCVKVIYDSKWALLYCINCHNNQWIYKQDFPYKFESDVIWLYECTRCSKGVIVNED